jgi:5-bromo-4-chloroindolyl phosphate hydrolysis protein
VKTFFSFCFICTIAIIILSFYLVAESETSDFFYKDLNAHLRIFPDDKDIIKEYFTDKKITRKEYALIRKKIDDRHYKSSKAELKHILEN